MPPLSVLLSPGKCSTSGGAPWGPGAIPTLLAHRRPAPLIPLSSSYFPGDILAPSC